MSELLRLEHLLAKWESDSCTLEEIRELRALINRIILEKPVSDLSVFQFISVTLVLAGLHVKESQITSKIAHENDLTAEV